MRKPPRCALISTLLPSPKRTPHGEPRSARLPIRRPPRLSPCRQIDRGGATPPPAPLLPPPRGSQLRCSPPDRTTKANSGAQPKPPAAANSTRQFLFRLNKLVFLEEKRDAPERGKRHKNVNNSADNARRAAEDPCHKVEAEQTDKPPVQPADKQDKQRNFIHHFDNYHSFQKNPRGNSAPCGVVP